MRFGSVCSGIEAASVAWHPLGWKAAWLAEIEKFPSAVLAHHYPDVPNLGDMRNLVRMILRGEIEAPDVFTGGTPCQAFSVAGKRESLSDDRGNLSITFCEIADAIDHVRAARGDEPSIIVWENVPGVLSTRDNAFGCFLGALAGSGCELQSAGGRWTDAGCVYGPKRTVAWRVLDAQYFGLAQRRRRVFVVASARNGFDPAAVLFERDGVRRDSAPRREAGKGITGGTSRRPESGHVVNSLTANNGQRNEIADVVNGSVIPWPADVACTLNAAFGDKQGLEDQHALSGASLFVPTTAFSCKDYGTDAGELAPTLRAMGHSGSHANAGGQVAAQIGAAVRRLTPRECERLQGFPDDYTDIPWKAKRAPAPAGPCAKQFVRATIVTTDGRYFIGTNGVDNPQPGCPRAPGEGYGPCADVCQQPAHAEVVAIRLAGKLAAGATLYVEGHTYACDACREAADAAGVASIVLGPSPGNAPDGPRYKALGNSWAVPCARWIGERIARALA